MDGSCEIGIELEDADAVFDIVVSGQSATANGLLAPLAIWQFPGAFLITSSQSINIGIK